MDDYSLCTWVHFLRSKDETPEVIKTFLKRITILFQSFVIIIRTDNGTEFKNQVLKEYFDSVGISYQVSSVRTPQQKGVVEQRNRTLVEAARTMLIFSRAPLFLWAEAIATACFTQNAPSFTVDLTKHHTISLMAKNRISLSFMYSGLSVIPRMIVKILGSLVQKGKENNGDHECVIDELSAMAFEQRSSKPEFQSMTSGQISSGLDLTYAPSTITTQQPTEGELDLLFEAMYDDYIGVQPSVALRTVLAAQAHQVRQAPMISTLIADTSPTPTNSSSQATNFPITSQDTKDHPLAQVIGEPSRPVLTRNQLRFDGDMCMYALTVSTMKPKNVTEAMTDPVWIESMQEELLQFKRLDV
uniref:Integrase catalytic domain-containing protein n=1 Tax=Tanacetum cinerariifolium TaxID=118510 RepID=A0A699JCB1_TANCI|nr:hypothetical protein [Tanacetum cinerariifolium]